MRGLPEGWEATTLDDVLTIQNGFAFKSGDYEEEGHFLIRIGNVQSGAISLDKPAFVRLDDKTERFALSAGDVLTSLTGNIGRVAKIEERHLPAALNQRVAKLAPAPALEEANYLFSFLSSAAFGEALASHGKGAAQQNVSPKTILGLDFPLPPLAEQRRIVEKLDQLSARTRAAKDHLARVQTLATRAKQATLATAFRGELTEDPTSRRPKTKTASIADPFTLVQEAPETWEQYIFSDVCRIVGGSQPAKSNFRYEPQDGYIRLIQIRDYKSDKKVTYIPRDLARRFCSETDIMIGRYGPPIFQILRGIEGAYNVALMKAEPTDAVNQEFLFWYLHHPMLFRYVEIDSKRTAGQDGVNKAHLQRWPILLPPLEEQTEIVRRIEAAFARIDRMVEEASRAAKLLERLEAQLLAKAFRGELVPQDPNDEPASVLLARIREARANAPKPKRRRKAKA